MQRRTWFLIGLLLQLLLVFGLFLPYVMHVSRGQRATLQTVPVDPLSIFRGEYVTLDYAVGQNVPPSTDDDRYGPLYVVLEPAGDDWRRVRITEDATDVPELAPGQLCLRASREWTMLRFPDIAQYFVEEGMGRELEDARNAYRLLVDISVADDCSAVITGVRVGEQLSEEELQQWRANQGWTDPLAPPEDRPERPEAL